MVSSDDWSAGVVGTQPPTTPRGMCGLAGVGLHEGQYRVDVGLVDERWTGQNGAAAAHHVAVLLEQVELRDRQVTLKVGLLVDAELEQAVFNCLGRVDVQVEGADLGRAVLRLYGLDGVQRLGGAERD